MGSWKTTVLGIAAGFLTAYSGGMDWKHALTGAVMAALGFVAKDQTATDQPKKEN